MTSAKKNIGFALLVSQPLRLFAKLLHCSLKTAISLLFFIIATLQIYFHLREAFSLSVNVRQNAAVFVTKIHRHYKFYIPPPSLVPVPLCIWVLNYRSRAEKFIINTSPLAPQVHTSQLNLGFSKRRLRRYHWSIASAKHHGSWEYILLELSNFVFVALFLTCSITIKTVKMSRP